MKYVELKLAGSVLIAVSLMASCGSREPEDRTIPDAGDGVAETNAVTLVTAERLLAADADNSNWLTHGRTYSEQRFSPLSQINTENVADLGLAWYFDVPTERGMEATPIVVDGRMYVTGSWSIVYALDAATGKELWRYDPGVPKSWAQYACCDVVNRGVAVWQGSVLVGTLDGYLVSIDAATGEERWRTDTIDRKPPYTITGAPRVINGLVVIGNGGAEYGVRGYVGAYDAVSGKLVWRFHTVPGNPDDGFESNAMKAAAETWTGEWWRFGGGGTVWDSMAYDPELDLLYIGTGNGSPWNRKIRSPEGGDNLYLSSIIALKPDSGEYVWHYQTTPGDSWDYTATQHIMLADIEVAGVLRKVLVQAPKNGFFYLIDRTNGELISAEPFVTVNWATGIDKESGRPIEAPNARYADGPFVAMPSPLGGHNWQPMAYSAATGLVYLPTQDMPYIYADDENFAFEKGHWNVGIDYEVSAGPDDPEVLAAAMKSVRGQLVAWDPIEQKEVWRYQHAGPWNGGVLATAGNLVMQGSLIGEFGAYEASSGERLWVFPAQTGIIAAPISYAVDDQQHMAVAAGWGSAFGLAGGEAMAALGLRNFSRILAFRLGGSSELPRPEPMQEIPLPPPPELDSSAEQVALGKDIYYERCLQCHGDGAVSGGLTPDLRHSTVETHAAWDAIVLGGSLQQNAMPGFGGILGAKDSQAIRAYVVERAKLAYGRQQAASAN
ncbi:MAG: PQQ-dependent dehydrogenase, methanol/ethanol family [Pseudomonadales bacterium]